MPTLIIKFILILLVTTAISLFIIILGIMTTSDRWSDIYKDNGRDD